MNRTLPLQRLVPREHSSIARRSLATTLMALQFTGPGQAAAPSRKEAFLHIPESLFSLHCPLLATAHLLLGRELARGFLPRLP